MLRAILGALHASLVGLIWWLTAQLLEATQIGKAINYLFHELVGFMAEMTYKVLSFSSFLKLNFETYLSQLYSIKSIPLHIAYYNLSGMLLSSIFIFLAVRIDNKITKIAIINTRTNSISIEDKTGLDDLVGMIEDATFYIYIISGVLANGILGGIIGFLIFQLAQVELKMYFVRRKHYAGSFWGATKNYIRMELFERMISASIISVILNLFISITETSLVSSKLSSYILICAIVGSLSGISSYFLPPQVTASPDSAEYQPMVRGFLLSKFISAMIYILIFTLIQIFYWVYLL